MSKIVVVVVLVVVVLVVSRFEGSLIQILELYPPSFPDLWFLHALEKTFLFEKKPSAVAPAIWCFRRINEIVVSVKLA